MVDRRARRLAVELEITSKEAAKRERILAGYAADPRIAKVLYVVYEPSVARALTASVSRLGLGTLVSIHRVRTPERPAQPVRPTREIARGDQRRVAELTR